MFTIERAVKHVQDAFKFVAVVLVGGGYFLQVQRVEPASVAGIWALATDLEGELLLAEASLLQEIVAKDVRSVVLLGNVLEDTSWSTCACCPPNKFRLLGHISRYIYAITGSST